MSKKKIKVGMKRSTKNILMGIGCILFALFCLFLRRSFGFFAFFMIMAAIYFTLVIKGKQKEKEFREKVKEVEKDFSNLDFDENEKAFFASLSQTEKKKKKGLFSKAVDDEDEYETMSQQEYNEQLKKLDEMLGTDEENRADDEDDEDDDYVNYDEEDDV